jgi:hypothetical protein
MLHSELGYATIGSVTNLFAYSERPYGPKGEAGSFPHTGMSSMARWTAIMLAVAILSSSLAQAQKPQERYWLAGRYDANRVVIFFQAVTFGGTLPPDAQELPWPVASGFCCPVKLPASYLARFQKAPGAEHFALGDKYDLIIDKGETVTVTLTTLVGAESDEGVGNNSHIGALASLEKHKEGWLGSNYYAARRHRQRTERIAYPSIAWIRREPVRLDIQTEILGFLTAEVSARVSEAKRSAVGNVPPSLAVQQFRLADGTIRYYARAEWQRGEWPTVEASYSLGGWFAPFPKLHVVAVELGWDFESLPELLNVIYLGPDRTGVIVKTKGVESIWWELHEYRDGVGVRGMPTLHSTGGGE